MLITATHINYYFICHRKLWLFSNGIHMEHTSETVAEGKLLHETSYPQRAAYVTEITLSAKLNDKIDLVGKIDFYDPKNKIIHETKKSDKMEIAHEWQSRFYIFLLELNGINGASAVLEYPKLRTTKEVILEENDRQKLREYLSLIPGIIHSENCPPVINSKICKSCSYYELCYVGE